MTRSSQLHALQLIDLTLDRDESRLKEIQRLLADDQLLSAARAAREEAARRSRQAAEVVRAAEDAVAGVQSKIHETENRLYSGALHNPKELQDLQRESESLQRHLTTLNERLLEGMLGQEQADQRLAEAESGVRQMEAESLESSRRLMVERQTVEADQARRAAEREAVEAGLPSDDLALYGRLRQSSGGVAVVTVEDGACGACGLILSASGRQEVRSSAAPVRCRQCGRVLYAG